MSQFAPLDFLSTLDLLASWSGREVQVIAAQHAPGEPLSHTQTVVSGVLGSVQMVDNHIDATADSVAAYSVGTQDNGFYISPSGFRRTQPLPGRESIRID